MKRFFGQTWPPQFASVLLAVVSLLLMLWVCHFQKFQHLELIWYDKLICWRATQGRPDPRIVLVTITEKDITDPQLPDWPLWNDQLARLLQTIEKHKRQLSGWISCAIFPCQKPISINSKD